MNQKIQILESKLVNQPPGLRSVVLSIPGQLQALRLHRQLLYQVHAKAFAKSPHPCKIAGKNPARQAMTLFYLLSSWSAHPKRMTFPLLASRSL